MEKAEQKNGKLIRPPRAHSTKEMYAHYKAKNPKSKEPYWMYKEVISRFNKKSADAVIFGQVLNFGNKIGNLLIKKIRRNYEKPVVDWGESKKAKAQLILEGKQPAGPGISGGERWLIYYSDPWYLRFAWVKKRICKVRNQTVYKFVPTSNRSKIGGDNSPSKLGNKGKLVLANKLNPVLHQLYTTQVKRED